MSASLAPLRSAWMLLTRIPLPRSRSTEGDAAAALRSAPAWFPLVGGAIGLLVSGCYAALHHLVGPYPAAAVALAAGALLTGALHHDGLADVADAFGGGWTVERRLEILKDSHVGAYGALALVCAFVVQTSALAQHDRAQGAAVLVAAHAIARGAIVALMRVSPRASTSGLGASYAHGLGTTATVAAVLGAVAIGTGALGWLMVFATAAATAAVAATGLLARRKIGGVTGDVLGAAEQLAETAVLLTGAALVRHGGNWPWWR